MGEQDSLTKKKVVKPRVPRTHNANTMTESQFFGWIRSRLRKMTLAWKPRQQCIKEGTRPYTGPNKRQKIEVHCEGCGGWFPRKEIDADHIVEAGSLRSFEDLPGFIERLLVERHGWRRLCKQCHQERTNKGRKKEHEQRI